MRQGNLGVGALILAVGIATTAGAAPPQKPGGPPGGRVAAHAAPAPHAAPPPRAAPAPHVSAPRAAPHMAAPHMATPHIAGPRHMAAPRLAPQAPHPAPQRFAHPSGVPSRSAAIRHAPTARAPEPAAREKPQFGQNGRNLVQPKPGDNLARQPGGTGPSSRIGRNVAPQNAPAQNQAGRAGGGSRALAGHVLRNPAFANQTPARDPSARALARSTFQGRFFDPGWRRRYAHPTVIGWVGPLFWPYAYDDFVDYTFYPYAYDTFWPYAYEDLYDGMFGAYAQGYGGAYAAVGRRASSGGSRSVSTDLCSGQTAGLTDWPIERIAQTVDANDAQRAALDELKDATAKALDVLKASCPSELPSTPTGRIEAMRQRLTAMVEAVRIVRPAIEKFYHSLDDEQKARFNAIGPDEDQQQSRRDLSQVCGERASGIAALPLERIEQAVRPDAAQRSALSELQDATSEATNLLESQCPTYRALTPVARLEAMEQRLDSMLRAVQTVEPVLAKFYGSLNDEQRERFNRLAPARG
jgi:ABC-type transporter MlaC component